MPKIRASFTVSQKGIRLKSPLPAEKPGLPALLDHALTDSCYAIINVGLYMMVFSILARLLAILIPGEGLPKALLLSSLEITGGLSLISRLEVPSLARYVLLMAHTSFGGACAIFQTASILKGSGLKILPYTMEKLATAVVASLLTYLYLLMVP